MATIYYYVDSSKLDQVMRFGIKLADNYTHTVPIDGVPKRMFAALLNPKDDMFKYNSKDYTCIKINVYPEHCFVVNEVTLILTPKDGDYGLIPLNDYLYGSYERPRVIFNQSILPEQISLLDDTIDEPILFDNSQDLYYRLRINEILEEHEPSDIYYALCEYLDYQNPKKSSNLDTIE